MLIIVEGADGVGKTTFVERIKQRAIFTAHHRGVPEKHPLTEYTEDLVDYRPGSGTHVVCDRWHWGELIYGPLYRGESKLGDVGWAEVDKFLNRRGAVIAYLTHEPVKIRRRWAERGEDYLQDEHLEYVLQRYEDVADYSRVPVLRLCDPTEEDVNRVCNAATLHAHFADRRWWS